MAHVAAGARISSRGGERSMLEDEWEERGMMVLLEKHVHLQNDGVEADTSEKTTVQSARRINGRRAMISTR